MTSTAKNSFAKHIDDVNQKENPNSTKQTVKGQIELI